MSTQPEAVDWFAECREASAYAFILKARLRQLQMENERLIAQRDALLAALKAAEPHLRHADVHYNVYVQCRAVIAAVEGEKK